MSNIDVVVLTLAIVLVVGVVTFLFSEKTHISYVPILIVLGLAVGPALHIIQRSVAHQLFEYARVFGLVIILFAEGHNLKWALLKKHFATIGLLDTVGLMATTVIAGLAFMLLFHVPFVVGFLFGAIIGATDPATLIPLFKQHNIDEDVRSVIVTESIFNDPLGIVMTVLAVALLVPQAPSAQFIERIAHFTTLYPAAVIFFLYEIGMSLAIGVALGMIGYWLIRVLHLENFAEIYSLALAFGGFALGEAAGASGYLVATIIGMVLGNHEVFFKRHIPLARHPKHVIQRELHFNEIVSSLATVIIFILLGASIDLAVLKSALLLGTVVALIVVFVARPVAGLTILPLRKWTLRQYLFMSFEGPRGIVPSALADLLLGLGLTYKNSQLVSWGESILAVTVVTILVSVLIETLWTGVLNDRLLKIPRRRPAAADSQPAVVH
ncbi:MAG TPA: sodium:proton antiporter [Spirochaetia bacterium]|nr:sodium:proton antiporter [Spirochaetia bacterium]